MNTYTNRAWLLSQSGRTIEVLNHPSEHFEFESILQILLKYGSESEQQIARKFLHAPSEEVKQQLLTAYRENWCKVRVWGHFSEEITFRIPRKSTIWEQAIALFLQEHPEFEQSKVMITVIS